MYKRPFQRIQLQWKKAKYYQNILLCGQKLLQKLFNENLPHQQYKLVETPSQATVEELLPNKRTNKNQNHWSQQLSLLQAFRYYIYQLFWSQRWETFIFEVSTISWRAHTVISDYAKISAAPCPVQAEVFANSQHFPGQSHCL